MRFLIHQYLLCCLIGHVEHVRKAMIGGSFSTGRCRHCNKRLKNGNRLRFGGVFKAPSTCLKPHPDVSKVVDEVLSKFITMPEYVIIHGISMKFITQPRPRFWWLTFWRNKWKCRGIYQPWDLELDVAAPASKENK